MKKAFLSIIALALLFAIDPGDIFARGGGRGGGGGGARMGGGGGGGARMGGGGGGAPRMSAPSRTPSMSRPSMPSSRPSAGMSQPSARPSVGGSRPAAGNAAARPGGARPGNSLPGAGGGARPGAGNVGNARPGSGNVGGVRPGTRPSTGQLNDFLGVKPGAGGGNGALGSFAGGVAGGVAGGAAADFLRDSGARPGNLPAGDGARLGSGARPGNLPARPGDGARPGNDARPGIGDGSRPSQGSGLARPSQGTRPGAGERPIAGNRPERIENRQQLQSDRSDRRDEILDEINDTPIRDFWQDNPGWAAWRLTAPYRWASWGALSGWVGYGYGAEAYPYSYGESVYYENGSVCYDGQPVATAEEYATQAQDIIESAPEVASEESEWMPLGVFALTQDGQATGPKPAYYVQLAINKQGVISGTLRNEDADTTQQIEGMADKDSQRVAWTVVDKTRPIMETGISNLTQDTSGVLVHFADGETQQWLMVHLDDPQSKSN